MGHEHFKGFQRLGLMRTVVVWDGALIVAIWDGGRDRDGGRIGHSWTVGALGRVGRWAHQTKKDKPKGDGAPPLPSYSPYITAYQTNSKKPITHAHNQPL